MRSVAIFGAGIAGLTVAHELCKSFASEEFTIHIYEKSDSIGGFAKSKRLNICNNSFPTEHSWRGYAPFYFNAFEIMKEIPVDKSNVTNSVYDNLTYPVHFLLPRDKMGDKIGEPALTARDVAVLGYHISKVILSSPERRKNVYARESFKDIVYPKLSLAGRDKIFGMIGPGLGLDLYTCSIYDVAKYAEMRFLTKHHSHKKYNRVGWHVMNAPTSEAWFDHWEKYLLQKGIHFHYNTELVDIIVGRSNDNVGRSNANLSVNMCVIKTNDNVQYVEADEYIFAINPFNMRDIISNNILLQKDAELQKFAGLCADGEHKQIAFQIAFDKKINFGKVFTNNVQETYAVAFPDSEFNITLYPQDKQFKSADLPTSGYWSGTACVCTRPGKLFNLPAVKLTKSQFIQEVKYQIFRSEEFKLMINTWNYPLEFADFNIVKFIVYPEWKFPPEVDTATEQERKWVTTINTEPYRPDAVCSFENLFLSGAHIQTSVSLWSMEGAVESGKITARSVLSKYNLPLCSLHTHTSPTWLGVFHKPDNLLHKVGAPNILVICVILIAIIVFCVGYCINFRH